MKPDTFFTLLLFSILSSHLVAKDIYVSPAGDDRNPGTLDQPLASLEGARDAVRNLRVAETFQEDIKVILLEGAYFIRKPLVLDHRDSGTEANSITYKGEAGKKVEIIGGMEISDFARVNDTLWKTHIPEVAENNWRFEQLYVNGKRAVRARTPNIGEFYNVLEVEETVFIKGTGRSADFAVQKIRADPGDLQSLKDEFTLENALLTFYHNWDNTKKYVSGYEPEEGVLYISGNGMKPWNKINGQSRFFIDNIKTGLDAAGEWFLEKDGTLFYIPLEGEKIEKSIFYAPVVEQFLIIKGEGPEGQLMENLHFEDLTFRVAGYTTPKAGNEPAQAAAPIEAVVMVDFAKNITFKGIEIANTGIGGIWFRESNFNNKVEQCYLHDLGAGGIKIGTFGQSPKEEDSVTVSKGNLVDNNIIRSAGWVFPCAVGVAIFHSSDNQVTHNEIADLRYSGISVGWVWGYAYSHAKRNLIKYNHIHHLGWGDLSDMGGVYTLGISEGTEVSNNVIHHVYSLTYGGWGLYTDEGSTDIVMENNLVYACKSAGFHQHYGKDNQIRNNIFAYNIKAQLQATRVEDHNSFNFSNNIIYFNTGTLLSSNWDKFNLQTDSNIFWDERGQEFAFGAFTFQEWQQKGNDKMSLIADPLFEDAKAFNFSFKSKATIRKTNFKPFDRSMAGVYGKEEWIKKALFNPDLATKFDAIVAKNEPTIP